MPRAKPKATPPSFQIHPFRLSAAVKEELISLLGFDADVSLAKEKIRRAISRIEHYVGRYLGIAKVEKELPGNASLIAELNSFIKRGEFNQRAFNELYPWLQHRFQQHGVGLSLEEQDCEVVLGIAKEIIESLNGEQRGRRTDRPFQDLIAQLRKIFRSFRTHEIDDCPAFTNDNLEHAAHILDALGSDSESSREIGSRDYVESLRRYQSESGLGQDSRYRSGSMQALSEVEYDEYEFVILVLKEAGIAVPKNLLDLFKRVGRPIQERAEVLNLIARRARRRQQLPG